GDIQPVLRTIDDDLHHGHPHEIEPADEPAADTEAILAELAATRGVRQQVNDPGHEEPMLWDDAARPEEADAGSASAGEAPAGTEHDDDHDVVSLPHRKPEPEPQPEPAPTKRRGRNRRTSVPSWDEIVFGAKND